MGVSCSRKLSDPDVILNLVRTTAAAESLKAKHEQQHPSDLELLETVKAIDSTVKMDAAIQDGLESGKWRMLCQWTAWHDTDQFGWAQPKLSDVVGGQGRTKLDGFERFHDYQV